MPLPKLLPSFLQSLQPRRLLSTSPAVASDFTTETVLATISSYANDWVRALDFFHWVESQSGFRHTADTCNLTIDVLGKFFEFDRAWTLVHRMQQPNHATFRVLFKRYVAAHLVQEAIAAFEGAEAFGLKDRTCFDNLVDALCEHRHVIEAEELCFKAPPFPPTTKTYNMILRGWYKMRWWRKCREFWEEMDRKKVDKDLHSYTIYMDIMAKSGKPWKSMKLYKEMKQKGVTLDVVAYNTVVQATGYLNGVDFSIRMYKEMIEKQCKPNVVTHNIIIMLLCKAGRFAEAYSFLNQMWKMDCEPDAITYHSFFQYMNRPKEILSLFERMMASGCQPRMDTYVMLLHKFGRWGFLRPVFIVWKVMEEQGYSPDGFAYNALIDALVQKGMIDMARKYDEEMLAKGLSARPRKELGSKVPGIESDNLYQDDLFDSITP